MKITSIPTPIKDFMSSPKTADFVENTINAVVIETALKMIGRPAFIMVDKEADSKSKKYSSVKEFLYQASCFGLYLSIVPTVKKYTYKGFSAILSKNSENKRKLDLFNADLNEIHLAEKIKDKVKAKDLTRALEDKIKNVSDYHLGKGTKELGAIVGSVLTLAILAPQISHYIVHPIMKILGFEDKNHGKNH